VEYWNKRHTKTQQLLYRCARYIVSQFRDLNGEDATIEYNASLPSLKYKESNKNMEMDIWIPELGIALEYQAISASILL
jgi:hypothetical protein